MSSILRVQLPTMLRVKGKPLGRHVVHDPRSLGYPAHRAAKLESVRHLRRVPVFDQGELGSCTGNAAVGCLSTAPFARKGTERDAVRCYSEATRRDDVLGTYPPADTGSSGLAVMQTLKAWGWIEGYRHAFGLDHFLRALVLRPGIVGITWLEGCDEPDPVSGLVEYRGAARGGHEFVADEVDTRAECVGFCNSWSRAWGKEGRFFMGFEDVGRALRDQGDVIFPDFTHALPHRVPA